MSCAALLFVACDVILDLIASTTDSAAVRALASLSRKESMTSS